MKSTFIEYLTEVRVQRNDPVLDDYYDQQEGGEDRNTREGPYAVGWSGQYLEWYGDKGPQSGEGRYKPKGDGGRIVAINVPSHTQAEDIRQTLDDQYEDGQLDDPAVYNEYGKDGAVTQYHGAYVRPMSELKDYELELYARRAKDYSKGPVDPFNTA